MSQKQDQTILITGASGSIATHIVNDFLRASNHVRGTVRSSAQGRAGALKFLTICISIELRGCGGCKQAWSI